MIKKKQNHRYGPPVTFEAYKLKQHRSRCSLENILVFYLLNCLNSVMIKTQIGRICMYFSDNNRCQAKYPNHLTSILQKHIFVHLLLFIILPD